MSCQTCTWICCRNVSSELRGRIRLDALLVVAVGLAVEFVEHTSDYTECLVSECSEQVL